jgi:hypothetical protein
VIEGFHTQDILKNAAIVHTLGTARIACNAGIIGSTIFSRVFMNNLSERTKKNNKSGITGVAVTEGFCHGYIVNALGKRISRKFSITKYGAEEALRLAITWRRDKEIAIHGYTVIPKEYTHQESKHQQSLREANKAKQLKKQAADEIREKKKKDLARQRKKYRGVAGKYIYRIDDLDLGHGWLLKIEIPGEVPSIEFFRDSRHGSTRAALESAQSEREKQLLEYNIPYAKGRRFSKALRSTNNTGITGTCRANSYYYSYIPTEPNKRKTRKFSINKYGEELAFRMAVEWRQEMEMEVYGGTVLTDEKIEEAVRHERKISR